jgi:hypothetical protein
MHVNDIYNNHVVCYLKTRKIISKYYIDEFHDSKTSGRMRLKMKQCVFGARDKQQLALSTLTNVAHNFPSTKFNLGC